MARPHLGVHEPQGNKQVTPSATAYDGCAYILNTDMHKERKVIVHLDGKTEELTLAPLELRSLPRKNGLQ